MEFAGEAYPDSELTISKCANKGEISSFGSGTNGYCGGIISYGSVNISECFNQGKINGNNVVGGIAGGVKGRIDDSFNGGNVIGGDSYGGGICGTSIGSVEIQNCYNYSGTGGSSEHWGYIIGNLSGVLNNCFYVDFGECKGVALGSLAGVTALEKTGIEKEELTDKLNAGRKEKIWSNNQNIGSVTQIITPGLSWFELYDYANQ